MLQRIPIGHTQAHRVLLDHQIGPSSKEESGKCIGEAQTEGRLHGGESALFMETDSKPPVGGVGFLELLMKLVTGKGFQTALVQC